MKFIVNGVETEIPESSDATVVRVGDRLIVKTSEGSFSAAAVRQGDTALVSFKGRQYAVERATRTRKAAHLAHSGEIRAPIPGQIADVLVKEGAKVLRGDKLLVLEAMKTQQAFTAPFDGIVSKLPYALGDQVTEGVLLASVEPSEST